MKFYNCIRSQAVQVLVALHCTLIYMAEACGPVGPSAPVALPGPSAQLGTSDMLSQYCPYCRYCTFCPQDVQPQPVAAQPCYSPCPAPAPPVVCPMPAPMPAPMACAMPVPCPAPPPPPPPPTPPPCPPAPAPQPCSAYVSPCTCPYYGYSAPTTAVSSYAVPSSGGYGMGHGLAADFQSYVMDRRTKLRKGGDSSSAQIASEISDAHNSVESPDSSYGAALASSHVNAMASWPAASSSSTSGYNYQAGPIPPQQLSLPYASSSPAPSPYASAEAYNFASAYNRPSSSESYAMRDYRLNSEATGSDSKRPATAQWPSAYANSGKQLTFGSSPSSSSGGSYNANYNNGNYISLSSSYGQTFVQPPPKSSCGGCSGFIAALSRQPQPMSDAMPGEIHYGPLENNSNNSKQK